MKVLKKGIAFLLIFVMFLTLANQNTLAIYAEENETLEEIEEVQAEPEFPEDYPLY